MNAVKYYYFHNREIFTNYFWRFLQILSKQGISFVIFLIAAKLLDAHEFGVYNYIIAIVLTISLISDFGISTAVSKFVAEYSVIERQKIKMIVSNSVFLIIVLTILLTIISVITVHLFEINYSRYFLYTLPMIFLVPFSSLYDGIYRGLRKFKKLSFISLLVGILSIGMSYFMIHTYGLIGAIISQVIFYSTLSFFLFINYREFNTTLDKQLMKKILGYSATIGIGSLSFFLFSRVDILFLGSYNYITEVGYLEIINKVFPLLAIPILIIGQVIGPQITICYTQKKYQRIFEEFKRYLRVSIFSAFVLTGVYYILLPYVLEYFLKQYNTPEMLLMLQLMGLPLFMGTINGIVPIGFITATGHYRIITIIVSIFACSNLILNYIFINFFGYIGVIYSTLINTTLANLLTIIVYYLKLRKFPLTASDNTSKNANE